MVAEENLMSIGFTKNQAKTYLALLELGEAKTGKLCSKLGIASSHIYRILDSLIKKGVVSVKILNNAKVFLPNDPHTLNDLYKQKQQELEAQKESIGRTIEELSRIPKDNETFSDYKYFEGVSGIRAMWLEIDELLEEDSEACIYISTAESWEQFNAFYLDHHRTRVKKNVKLKMIIPKGLTEKYKEFAKQRKDIGLIEIRFVEGENQSEFGIYGDLLMLQDTSKATKNPRGFLINDAIFSNTFKDVFQKLWESNSEKF